MRDFNLYAITDIQKHDPQIADKIDAAYRGGADVVQIRSKTLTDSELLRLGQSARIAADHHKKMLIINDRWDIAAAVGADGVHFGQDDLPVAEARRLSQKAGISLIIGQSTHSIEQAVEAEKSGADYIGVGPVFETPTKPGRQAVGLELVKLVSAKISIPWVAIGGIDLSNVQRVIDAGARRIAVVRAIFAAEDILHAAQQFSSALHEKKGIYV